MTTETIHISLTSISSRMHTVHHTLQSLLDQDHGDLIVHLYLSKEPYLLDEGVPDLPKTVQKVVDNSGGRLQVHYTTNIGPYRKLLPFLYHYWGKELLVVTADDDTIYPSNWLRTLYEGYKKFHCSIAFRGHRVMFKDGSFTPYRSWMKSQIFNNPSKLILPTGKDGILYNTAMFPETILDLDEALRLAPTADDMWFRWNLAMNNVPVYVIQTDYTESFEENDYETSLYLNFNRAGQNDIVIRSLNDFFKVNHKFDFLEGGVL